MDQKTQSPNPQVRVDRVTTVHALFTVAAAVISLLAARACGLQEDYWAVILTLIVMQSSIGAAWAVSRQWLVGTLIGSATAAGLVAILRPGILPFVIGLLVQGLVCVPLRLDKSGYRFACITLAIILLPSRSEPIWTVVTHRFFEVVIGIAVGMAVMALSNSLVRRKRGFHNVSDGQA